MSKWKDRVEKILETEASRIEKKYIEVQGNYRDTGYTRYYNQMEKLQSELDEIDFFRHSALNVARAEAEARRYRSGIKLCIQKMDSYILDHKGVERPIEETVKEMRARLLLALSEAGIKY